MSLTVLEQIARTLYDRLDAMRNSDAYSTQVTSVVRPRRLDDFTPRNGMIVMTQGDEEEIPELSYPGNPPAVAKRQTFNLACFVINSERECAPIDSITNTFAADVRRAVCTPQANWYQMDGKAIDTTFGATMPMAGDGGADGVVVPVLVVYRTDEDNPFNLRG